MHFTKNGEGGNGTHDTTIISGINAYQNHEIRYAAHTDDCSDKTLTDAQLSEEDVFIIRMKDRNG